MVFLCCFSAIAGHRFIKASTSDEHGNLIRVVPATGNGWYIFSLDSLRLTRFNSCGDALWSRKYDIPNTHNSLTDFIQTKNNGFALLTRMHNGSVHCPLVTLIDTSGNITWSRSYEDPSYNNFPYTLNQDNQGNLVIFSNVEHVSNSPFYNMITRIDISGNHIWSRFYNHGGIWGGAIVTSDNGVLFRTGSRFVKTNQAGNVQWTSQFISSTYNYYAPVEVIDGYIFTGYNTTTQNISFYKMEKLGYLLWGGKRQTDFLGIPPKLISLPNGNFSCVFNKAGQSSVIEFDKDLQQVNRGTADLSAQGIPLYGRDFCIAADGTPVIAGITGSSSLFISSMDVDYRSACQVIPSPVNITVEPVTQSFISTTVQVTVPNTVNRSYQSVPVSVVMAPLCEAIKQLDLGPDTVLCQGASMVLENLTGDIFDYYIWSTGATTSSITIMQPGTYWLVAFDECVINSRSDTVWIDIRSPVVPDLGRDVILCEDEKPLELVAPACSCNYLWNNGTTSGSITVDQEGIYWLEVDNFSGCIGSDTVTVKQMKCECYFYVPNAFTPNSDGKNEHFKPVYDCDVSSYNMRIYNRWGQAVFETSEIEDGWDGRFKGSDAPGGIYVYVISYIPLIKGNRTDRTTRSGTVGVFY